MKKLSALALGLVLVAGPALASNTGFKLNYTLHKKGSNNNWTSVPYFYYPNGNVGDPQNAADFCKDINEGDFVNKPVGSVVAWNAAGDSPVSFACGGSFNPFAMVPGQAYSLKPKNDNTVVNLVGSHDDQYATNKGSATPSFVTLHKKGSNNNWISIPYHIISNNALELCREKGVNPTFPTTPLAVGSVVLWNAAGDAPVSFACNGSFNPFVLNPGDGVSFKPAVDNTNIQMAVY